MTATAYTHENLATKKDVDARFDIVEERLDRIERRLEAIETAFTESRENYTRNFAQLNNSIVALLNTLATLTGRVNTPDDNHRRLVGLLERIEKRVIAE